MFVQCLIQRADDSDTFVDFEQVRYRFTKNAAGHHVCFVGGDAHRRRLLAMGPLSYRLYVPPKDLVGPQGAAPEPMTRNVLKKKPKPADPGEHTAAQAVPPAPKPPKMIDFDWTLDEKVAKVKEFKFLAAEVFKDFVDDNRANLMKWPIDVRREVAKKIDKMMPEDDPGIEGFKIDDYLGKRSPGDS